LTERGPQTGDRIDERRLTGAWCTSVRAVCYALGQISK
jgi:hypothetical protein